MAPEHPTTKFWENTLELQDFGMGWISKQQADEGEDVVYKGPRCELCVADNHYS